MNVHDLPEQIARRTQVDPSSGCWLWTGSRNRQDGYRHLTWRGALSYVHRVAYEHAVGPIPTGWTIDHVEARDCRNKHCCNPAHLEAVPFAENAARTDWMAARARRTQCPHGHQFTPENTYIDPSRGYRQCRKCRRDSGRDRRSAKSREILLDRDLGSAS